MKPTFKWLAALTVIFVMCQLAHAATQSFTPLGAGFTYQGQIAQTGVPLNGTVNLRFSLWDAAGVGTPPVGGNQLGASQLLANVPVANGIFSVILNAGGEFGPAPLAGERRYLQIEVCAEPVCATVTTLTPRQPLTGVPYALGPWNTSASGALSYTGTGKVGIGTSNPAHRLHVSGGPAWTTNGWSGSIALDNASAIGWGPNALGNSFGIGQSGGGLFFFRSSSSPGTANTEAIYDMIITDSGRVGIGTTAPSSALEIAAQDGLAITGYQPFLTLRDTNANGTRAVIQSVGGGIGLLPESYLSGTDPAAFVLISPEGKVGIGTTSLAGQLSVHSQSAYVYGVAASSPNGVAIRGTTNIMTAIYGLALNGGSGIVGEAVGAEGRGVWGIANSGGAQLAGIFHGSVNVSGMLTKSSGAFRIDHPLDPVNKYLSHSFVESPDMKNIYDGMVLTDEMGLATIPLPEWFGSLNRDFRYQLTVIDGANSDDFVMVKVVREIENNVFTIRSSRPHTKVSWQVTGIRQDAWANAHRVVVEEDKPERHKGTYLAPEVFGQPEEKREDYERLLQHRLTGQQAAN